MTTRKRPAHSLISEARLCKLGRANKRRGTMLVTLALNWRGLPCTPTKRNQQERQQNK
jgi:hypothetical protein